MAWITKNSAGMKVPEPETPWLTDELKKTIREEILPRYEDNMGAILPVLHAVQHHVGYLPYRALMEVAEFIEVPAQILLDSASFYDEFHLEPIGRYTIGICQSISCEVCGHQPIVDHLREKLGIEPDETTDDGLFTLRTMECLGSCDTAPCGLFNDDRRDNLTIDEVDRFIDEIRASETPPVATEANGADPNADANASADAPGNNDEGLARKNGDPQATQDQPEQTNEEDAT